MGIVRTAVSALTVISVSIGVAIAAQNPILKRLESGEVITSKSGSSFLVQALVAKAPEKVEAAFSDFKKLPSVFKEVAYASPYKSKDGRQLVYLKLKGLGDGIGVLMEVKSAPSDAFVNAKELVLSAEDGKSRDIGSEVDVSKDPADIQLRKEIDETNKGSEQSRFVGSTSGIVLEGPLNEILQMPTLRLTINLGFSMYQMPEKETAKKKDDDFGSSERRTYLVAKVSFGNQVPRRAIGDYRGIGERRLSTAEAMGQQVIERLKKSLENL